MQFNEFQRRLQDAGFSQGQMFILSHLFETQQELMKQGDTQASLILKVVEQVSEFVRLHESTQGIVKELARRGMVEGVSVASVRNDPEED